MLVPHGGGGAGHAASVVLEELFDVPLLSEELVLVVVAADLEHGGGRGDVPGVLELGEQLGHVGEARRVDVVVLVHGDVVRGIAGVDDVDECECVVRLQLKHADVGVRRRRHVDPVGELGTLHTAQNQDVSERGHDQLGVCAGELTRTRPLG